MPDNRDSSLLFGFCVLSGEVSPDVDGVEADPSALVLGLVKLRKCGVERGWLVPQKLAHTGSLRRIGALERLVLQPSKVAHSRSSMIVPQ
jgi:hypothetical protein